MQPRPLARHGQVLARESAAEDIARRQVVLARGADIIEHHGVRPLRGEQLPAVRVFLDVGDDLHAGLSAAQVEAADASE